MTTVFCATACIISNLFHCLQCSCLIVLFNLLHINASNLLIPECLLHLQGFCLVENLTVFSQLIFLQWAEGTTDCWEQIFSLPKGFIDLISVFKYQFKRALSYINILFCRETGSLARLITSLKENVFGSPTELLKLSVPSLVYALQNNMAFVALSNLDAAVYQVIHVFVSDWSVNTLLFAVSWDTRARCLSAEHTVLSLASVLKAKWCFVIFRAYAAVELWFSELTHSLLESLQARFVVVGDGTNPRICRKPMNIKFYLSFCSWSLYFIFFFPRSL